MKLPPFITPKRLLVLAVIIISIPIHVTVKGMVWYQEQELLKVSETAPTFSIRDAQGNQFGLAGLKGKVVLLTFCKLSEPLCHAQGRELNAFAEIYEPEGLEILFIAQSPSVEEMADFEKKVEADYYILRDAGGKIGDYYHVKTYPTHYLIDRNGAIIASLVGQIRLRSARYRKLFEYALGKDQ